MILPKKLFITIPLIISFIFFTTSCGLFYDFDTNGDSQNETEITGENANIEEEVKGPEDPINEKADGNNYDNPRYTVTEVIDGDTIVLSNSERIRLLGMNTPEEGMHFYAEAREVLEIMILGKEVWLERDISDYDQYGRKLRYVYSDGIFVNLEMVKRGFANIFTFPPDVKYSKQFLEAERYARENDLGLWESSKITMVSVDVFYNASGNDNENMNGEFVIIKNTGPDILDTSGWTLKDSGTNIYHFSSHAFDPGARIILFSGEGRDRDENEGEKYLFWNNQRPVWNNDHDTLYLRDGIGLLIEIYSY